MVAFLIGGGIGMKVFISQPMKGKSSQVILTEREMIIEKAKAKYGVDTEIIDSYFDDVSHDKKPLWYLGKSIQLLSDADVIILSKDWRKARGCRIEHLCALAYGIDIIYLNFEDLL